MKLSAFDYHLPKEKIAQTPIEPRDSSKLMVISKINGSIQHKIFNQIVDLLSPGDLLVVNQTRVFPARLFGKKIPTGGKVEVLLLNQLNETDWETLVGGSRMTAGKEVKFTENISLEILKEIDGGHKIVRFNQPINNFLNQIGEIPLPPYIHQSLEDPTRYQTVYANDIGSTAAPTAGLHFTDSLIQKLDEKNIELAYVTLHVGLDTFAPVKVENIEDHHIHTEWCQLTDATAKKINMTKARGNKIVAVGTTSVRVLESAAYIDSKIQPFSGPTNLFILPGYKYKTVDAMITNFHLPKSTLLMLVSAFVGKSNLFNAYETAIIENYRFFSFGDAMFIA
jgi:S-adenosylmethionine:tRNA ribosyltransferase-isomerase